MLTVDVVAHDGRVVVACRGRILIGAEADLFAARMSDVVSRRRRIVLDLREVTDLDAHGVGLIAALIHRTRSRPGALILATRPGLVRRLLSLTRLDTQVPCVLWPGRWGASEGEGDGASVGR